MRAFDISVAVVILLLLSAPPVVSAFGVSALVRFSGELRQHPAKTQGCRRSARCKRFRLVPLSLAQEATGAAHPAAARRHGRERPRALRAPVVSPSKSSLAAAEIRSTAATGDGVAKSPPAEVTALCDQCGDKCSTSELAVCNAPECGVEFAQCSRCGAEYAGCCSAACQAMAAEVGGGEGKGVSAPSTASSGRRPRVRRRTPPRERDVQGAGAFVRSEGISFGGQGSLISADSTIDAGRDVMQAGNSRERSSSGSRVYPLNGVAASSVEGPRNDAKGVSNAEGGASVTPGNVDSEGADGGAVLESYASRHSSPESPCLAGVREATNRAQPGGAHMVSGHLQGELLKLLTRLCGAKRVLDIGTFTGYSALAFAEALPEDGVVVTLESDARAAETARGHFKGSEHGVKIRLLLGQAMDGIDQLIEDGSAPFDVIFIDADKKRYWEYYDKVLTGTKPLLAARGILLADNVLFHELVPLAEALVAADNNPQGRSPPVDVETPKKGVLAPTPRRLKIAQSLNDFNKRVKEDERVEVLMLPMRDGLSVVRWRDGAYPKDAKR